MVRKISPLAIFGGGLGRFLTLCSSGEGARLLKGHRAVQGVWTGESVAPTIFAQKQVHSNSLS